MELIVNIFVWVLLPAVNFYICYHYSQKFAMAALCQHQSSLSTNSGSAQSVKVEQPVQTFTRCPEKVESATSSESAGTSSISCEPRKHFDDINMEIVRTVDFDSFRAEKLAPMNFPAETVTLRLQNTDTCTSYNYLWTSREWESCMAVVYVHNTKVPYTALRFNDDINEVGVSASNPPRKSEGPIPIFTPNDHNIGKLRPVGTFRKVPKDRGRDRIREKMWPFLEHFDGPRGIAAQTEDALTSRGFKVGDDIIVMVVNEGEIDLYLNFACSARLHDISLRNVLVFAGSSEIVTMVRATGAMGLYHQGYGSVSKKASNDYLDRVFVDMMWYKAFSIFLVLRLGMNILFQDVDLVWFRDPFPYFHEYINRTNERAMMTGSHTEAFFSDDGQRSHRYTPFFANSGFYYLKSSWRSVNFAWSIMQSFDTVQVGGSHQNVFTMRLVEGLGIGYPQAKLLPLFDFPTGMMFHHNKKYMKKMLSKEITPYHFHMCWTQGKADKLKYFRETKLWYIQETCPLSSLIPEGSVYSAMANIEAQQDNEDVMWNKLSETCCNRMPGSI